MGVVTSRVSCRAAQVEVDGKTFELQQAMIKIKREVETIYSEWVDGCGLQVMERSASDIVVFVCITTFLHHSNESAQRVPAVASGNCDGESCYFVFASK